MIVLIVVFLFALFPNAFAQNIDTYLPTTTIKIANKGKVKGYIAEATYEYIRIVYTDRTDTTVLAKDVRSIDGFTLEEYILYYSKDAPSNDESYTASNGVTYSIGDKIVLGRGSAPNGDFVYLSMGGAASVLSVNMKSTERNEYLTLGASLAGLAVELKKIKIVKLKGQEKVLFIVGGGNITNYHLYIEDAIATCEVKDCLQTDKHKPSLQIINQPDKYDQLKKLKELFDNGTLTEEEFMIEKRKLLDKD